MKVTLKDGSSKEYSQAMSIIDIAKDISEGLARVACVAELDGEVVDLRTIVDGEHTLNILTFDSDEGKAAFRHTHPMCWHRRLRDCIRMPNVPLDLRLRKVSTMILI